MKISIVIPAYNEEENIMQTIFEVSHNFPSAEIIVVNDASTDRTLEFLETMKLCSADTKLCILTNEENMGHGFSIVRGLRRATGELILYIDADRQISLENANINTNAHFVSSYRVDRHDKLFRKLISFVLRNTIRFKYGYKIRDSNCPFKIYWASDLKPLLDELPDTYIIPIACLEVLARKHNIPVETIPVLHLEYQGNRKGFLQSINLKMLKFLFSAFKEITSL